MRLFSDLSSAVNAFALPEATADGVDIAAFLLLKIADQGIDNGTVEPVKESGSILAFTLVFEPGEVRLKTLIEI